MIVDIFKAVIVGASLFSLGLVGYLAYRNVRSAMRTEGHERRLNISYAVARCGFVLTIGLVTEAVMRAPSLTPDYRLIGYTIGVVAAAIGYLGVVYESRHTFDKRGRS